MIDKCLSPYDVADYTRHAFNLTKVVVTRQTKKEEINPKDIQSCLAFLPVDVIKQTLGCTTQLAKWHVKVPMQKHWKP